MFEYLYRVRPVDKNTLDEMINMYLWYSCPSGFNDVKDANFDNFIKDTNWLLDTLSHFLTVEGVNYIKTESKYSGICCFTKKRPSKNSIGKFPSGKSSIIIEYHRTLLENHLRNTLLTIPLYEVQYSRNPTAIKINEDGEIIKTETGNGYHSIPISTFVRDLRNLEWIFEKMFTQIDIKHRKQKEIRSIISGKRIPDKCKNTNGYKIPYPADIISKIYVYQKGNSKFVKSLCKIDEIKDKIEFIN